MKQDRDQLNIVSYVDILLTLCFVCKENVCHLLGFEHDSSEWGEGDLQGLRVIVTCDGFGVDGAEVAHVAAAIALGVAVDEFAVGAGGGYADAVVFSWDGGKVAGKDQRGVV